MFRRFAVVHLLVVLGHQGQAGVVNVIVVVTETAQTGDRVVPMEKAFFLIIGVTGQEKVSINLVRNFSCKNVKCTKSL